MDRFLEQSCKRIQTTMIGALSKMENNFGHLWGHFSDEELSPEQEMSILNQGNKEIRNLKQDYLKARALEGGGIPLTIKTRAKFQPPKE